LSQDDPTEHSPHGTALLFSLPALTTIQMASSDEVSPRPQLPSNFANELWQRYAAQQKRTMPKATAQPSSAEVSLEDYTSFTAHLKSSTRILALFGAGLSAASGIPTFRGSGGFWREYDCMTLATPSAFSKDPALVWQFYSYRRHCALRATPNKAHLALAELAKKKPDFFAISQNVDGMYTHSIACHSKIEL
jgi:hypothetical protein